jgi:hypothetical protein
MGSVKTVIEMAREVGARAQQNKNCDVEYLMSAEALERFAALVIANHPPQSYMTWQEGFEAGKQMGRNATLDEIADKIGKMPFGDTAASFAVWIREQKT